ncbi:cyclophane-forming radical SAM/SPASM peptide maturase YhhB [Sphingobium tyrosinilyticum]|uniref:Cyclophane-forming radical SAM/SPASM peptide maturase YhhB n=1 Tax=Sphingobium tyrosinilyticum TaxID=2715436 RepID=A0ABV9F492_9SPHN
MIVRTIATTAEVSGRTPFIDTVLLKVASRCNLDCSYCYVFNMGDEGWRRQPKRLPLGVEQTIVSRLGELLRDQGRPFSIVLHGGEPLLLGRDRLNTLFAAFAAAVPSCGLHIQTNGTLLDSDILDLCAQYGVGVSVSLDGPVDVNDAFRVDLRGRGSFARVMAAIQRLRDHPAQAALFSGLLAVVDPRSDPDEVYHFFKETGTPSVDFLYRDGNHTALPFGKASFTSTEYGTWMTRILDLYLADPTPPRIRVLDDMIKLTLGGRARKEGIGVSDYGIVVIDTDGSINKNDTLKSTADGADTFDTPWSVLNDRLSDVVATAEFRSYHEAQRPISSICKACPDLHVCGGGMPTHRWSDEKGLDNPTVFCADQRLLIGRVREHLRAHVGEVA